MLGKASRAMQQKKPASLVERLAALDGRATDAGSGEAPRADRQGQAPRRHPTRTYFALGLAASAIGGCGILSVLLFLSQAQQGSVPPRTLSKANVTDVALKREPARRSFVADTQNAAAPARVNFTIRKSERAKAPFPLAVTDVDPDDDLSVIVSGLPPAASLSRGERRDASTWVLAVADLQDLYLMLPPEAPDAFDATIEVLSAHSAWSAKTVAQIQVLDDAAPAPVRASAKVTTVAPFRTEVRAAPRPQTIARPALAPSVTAANSGTPETMQPPRVQRPAGMSLLGAPSDDPTLENRQIWWKMPMPAWAPFIQPGR